MLPEKGLEDFIRQILDDWFVMSGIVSNEALAEHIADRLLAAVKQGQIKELTLRRSEADALQR